MLGGAPGEGCWKIQAPKVLSIPELHVVLLSHLGKTRGSNSLTEASSGPGPGLGANAKPNKTGLFASKSTQLESQRWPRNSLRPYRGLTRRQ